ncbi:hypothetical protein VP01_6216g2 [Puccinia sorghi]|uniref:Uncharacterized protein n=1 Tax=Puccinia sorghi TaxID=27349 RepID=A0A0L6UHE9_9BASI|nr:hypothetical protein VP01_6216g2 [Puccinia sorghi]
MPCLFRSGFGLDWSGVPSHVGKGSFMGSFKLAEILFFPCAQHLVAILITGRMHNIISRTQFEKVRALVEIFELVLPHWTTLEGLSVFDNKCYSLSLGTLLSLV